MGQSPSNKNNKNKKKKKSSAIEAKSNANEGEYNRALREHKLFIILLQGAGDSGKSTIMKQIQLLHSREGFSSDFREMQKKFIHESFLAGCEDLLVEHNRKQHLDLLTAIRSAKGKGIWETSNLVAQLQLLSQDEELMKLIESFALPQLFVEYLHKVSVFGSKDWVPSDRDILFLRLPTTGIEKRLFRKNDLMFEVIDVGGQKSQRKKYLNNMFGDVDEILFVAALGDYDLQLWEDDSVSRPEDSLQLFKRVASRKVWLQSSVVLLLNKFDSFQEKYFERKIPLPAVSGSSTPPPLVQDEANADCAKAVEWMTSLYLDSLPEERSRNGGCFVHTTVAVDTSIMKNVIEKAMEKVVRELLDNMLVSSF